MKNIILFFSIILVANFAFAKDSDPINFTTREIIYNNDTGLITAIGGVNARQGDSTLQAPHFEFDTKRQEFYASEGVKIKRGNTSGLTIDSVIFNESINSMQVNNLEIQIEEATLIAKTSHKEGDTMILNDISYTSCDRSEKCMPWEIKASSVKRTPERLTYHGAKLYMFDVPVMYLPYFSHPDPSVKRISGFLVPSFTTSQDLGFALDIPYYMSWSPYSELMITPKISSKEGLLFGAGYKQNTKHLQSKNKGAWTTTDSNYEDRGYLFSKNNIYINDIWRGLVDIQYASDDTFLRKYDISSEAYLKTTLRLEGLHNRSYFSIYSYDFNDMRDNITTAEEIPMVLPAINYIRKFEPFSNGITLSVNIDTASLYFQDEQKSSQRFSGDFSVLYPYIAPMGLLIDFEIKLREDLYYLADIINASGEEENTLYSRTTPIGSVKMHMPFYKSSQNFYQIIDPIVQFVSSPNDDNTNLPNWDSQAPVFDDSNVFSTNRYEGYDRVESGNRLNYGVWWNMFGKTFGKINMFLGQTYNFTKSEDNYDITSGVYKQQSDYVGSIFFYPADYIRFNYKFRSDNKDFSFSRNEFNVVAGDNDINFRADYIYDKEASSTDEIRQEVYGRFYYRPYSHIAFYIIDRYDIALQEQREIGGGLIYERNCFKIDLGAKKEYVSDRDYEGQESIFINISLKTLGAFGIGESWEQLEKRNAW